jgi:hypothetical protein
LSAMGMKYTFSFIFLFLSGNVFYHFIQTYRPYSGGFTIFYGQWSYSCLLNVTIQGEKVNSPGKYFKTPFLTGYGPTA